MWNLSSVCLLMSLHPLHHKLRGCMLSTISWQLKEWDGDEEMMVNNLNHMLQSFAYSEDGSLVVLSKDVLGPIRTPKLGALKPNNCSDGLSIAWQLTWRQVSNLLCFICFLETKVSLRKVSKATMKCYVVSYASIGIWLYTQDLHYGWKVRKMWCCASSLIR